MNFYRFFFIVFYLLMSFTAKSQKTLCGKVLDSLTLKPISFAVVSTLTTGVYCDSVGTFELKNIQDDVINISCVGYQKKTIPVNYNKFDTIYLTPLINDLPPIVLGDYKWLKNKNVQIGILEGKSKFVINVPNGLTIVKYFPSPNSVTPYIIGELKFKLSNATSAKPDFKARIRIFEAIDNQTIGEEILNSNDIFTINKAENNLVTLNLNKYAFQMPANGCFLGIEFIGNFNQNESDRSNNFMAITGWLAKSFENGHILRKYFTNDFSEYLFGSVQKVNLYFALSLYENK